MNRRALLPAALLALALALLLACVHSPQQQALRNVWQDQLQRQYPRERVNDSVVIVQIDDDSLATLGQWPWPRGTLATLIEKLLAAKPTALGIDMVLPEADRYGPEGDARLAEVLTAQPVVLGVIGLQELSVGLSSSPFKTPAITVPAHTRLTQYAGAVRNQAAFSKAAYSEALLNPADNSGLVRRVPTLALVGGTPLPGLAIELLRIASVSKNLPLRTQADGSVRQVAGLATDPDGGWPLHFSDYSQRPHISAAQVLNNHADLSVLEGRLVLLGYTAAGLLDVITTPLGVMPGVEAHAEALDNFLDGRLLSRPPWASGVEAFSLLLLAALGILLFSQLSLARAVGLYGLSLPLLLGLSAWAFISAGWQLDPLSPSLGAVAVLALYLGQVLTAARRQQQQLAIALQHSREAQARLEGELDAAQRIQLGMLPQPERVLRNGAPLQIAAHMRAARTVGGDLYDFFRNDDELWFLVGDVSGKGLPASLFMSLAKSQIQAAALRAHGDPGLALRTANQQLSQENPEQQFVTVLVGVLNLATGALALCSAGHDAPLRLRNNSAPSAIALVGGPPLCMLDDFPYIAERHALKPNDGLLLFTDGAIDIRNPKGEFLGRAAWLAAVHTIATLHPDAAIGRLRTMLASFQSKAELADDVTLLMLRWLPTL